MRFFIYYDDAERERKRQQAARARFIPELLPHQVAQSLFAAKGIERKARWRCETFATPTEILRDLQAVVGPGSRVYVSLSQQRTFLLHDIVVPSPEEWAAIKATGK
jgi:hypothetical protein